VTAADQLPVDNAFRGLITGLGFALGDRVAVWTGAAICRVGTLHGATVISGLIVAVYLDTEQGRVAVPWHAVTAIEAAP
jgi:hypothetical protein